MLYHFATVVVAVAVFTCGTNCFLLRLTCSTPHNCAEVASISTRDSIASKSATGKGTPSGHSRLKIDIVDLSVLFALFTCV